MPKYFKIIALAVLLSQSVFADFTIHVLSPWKNDTSALMADSLRMAGNGEVGYYSGSSMYAEGGGWFYYTYKTSLKTDGNSFTLVDWGAVTWVHFNYPSTGSIRIDSLFAMFPPSTNELWIVINDTTQPYQVYATPPHGKVIYLFNPWPNNSSQISIDNRPPMKMQSRTDICGWYTCYYVGPPDSLYNVYFTDYFHTQKYVSSGLVSWALGGTPIDLRAALSTKDTVYIFPKPFPYGPPGLYSTFPGQTGDCGLRKVSGIFRDWKFDVGIAPVPSFFNDPMGARSGGKGMVQTTLQPPDYKPQLTAAAAAANPPDPPVSTWYNTITFPGTSRQNDTCIDLTLKKSDDGTWTFNSDDMGGFFPLDSFNDPNNIKYWNVTNLADSTKLGSKKHNYHFSMEMHLQFIYYKNKGLEFDFKGDDDLWIFINNQLAVDLGGLNYLATDTLLVDTLHIGLVDGQTYNMDIFYAERNPIGSNLIIQTTMDLENSANLYYVASVLGPGKTQYFILEHVQSDKKTCGFTPLFNQIDTPTVKFFIQGPQYLQPFQLQPGNPINGITIDASNPKVTLDSATLDTTLLPGDYHITFTSTVDSMRTGYLVFTVPPLPPNHLDILTDSTVMDPAKDAVIDSIYLPMDKPSTQVYAVLRDKNGGFVSTASAETWTSRDTSVVTIAPLPGDKSCAVITKIGTGRTWIVVTQAGLKPDSVLVSAIALPAYPIISSAVMLDTNADIIPDMLFITLNDTFHTNQKLDSVVITYRGQIYSIPASKTVLAGKTLFVPFAGVTSDAQPSGTAAIFMTVDAAGKSYSKTFVDGVGPALISAVVLENDGTNPDILFLAFSEPVTPASLMGKQLLLMSAGSSDTVQLTVTDFANTANDSVYSITLSPAGKHPLAGDRLRLVPGSQGGTISDQNANRPHDLNRSVVLGFKPGPTSIVSAWYRDGNADGFIDTVAIAFKRPVQVSSVQMIVIKWISPSKIDTVQLSTLKKLNDSTYFIPVHGESLIPKMVRTNIPMELLATYTDFPDVPPRSAILIDSAAPVLIDTAKLVYGNSPDSTFLTISFSENVRQPGNHPFYLLSKASGVQYQFRLTLISTNGNSYTFHVDAIEGGVVPYAGNGDLIWINTDSLPPVSDVNGCMQRNPLNRRVVLYVVMPPMNWDFPISKNPFVAGSAGGSEIGAVPRGPVIDADQYSLTIDIFDMIGNLVISSPMHPKVNGWSYTWDGRNRNSRTVGTGVYSAIIRIYKNNIANSTKRIRIGIKR
jgi:fibro-slime domain